jgi:hypothetical protein
MSQPATTTRTGDRPKQACKRGISHEVRFVNDSIVMTECGHNWQRSEVDIATSHPEARDCQSCERTDSTKHRRDDGTFLPSGGDDGE